jgi:hypothetical protein
VFLAAVLDYFIIVFERALVYLGHEEGSLMV